MPKAANGLENYVPGSKKLMQMFEHEDRSDIKVSRGEENIFIWCFFLAIVQLVLDGAEAYKWVKYVYVDDPISSLDENNAVMVAHHLAQMLSASPQQVKAVISTHHVLFFNVLCNELKKSRKYFLTGEAQSGSFLISETDSTPFLHHLAALVELHKADRSGAVYTHHFNVLRRVMEQTASFFLATPSGKSASSPKPTIRIRRFTSAGSI